MKSRATKILAIETSCDETAIAILERKGAVLKIAANFISSQVTLHQKYGGVVPNLARREHEKNLVPLTLRALKSAGLLKKSAPKAFDFSVLEREEILGEEFKKMLPIQRPGIHAIAVTSGPGLAPALWTGVNFAKALSMLWDLPLIPANHMEGHVFSSLIKKKGRKGNEYALHPVRFPVIALLVSGGHTELHLVKKLGSYTRLGRTLDDAAGEAFDKVAKMLGLPYPGGPEISRLGRKGNPQAIHFPRPLLSAKNYDFSFSGLKTSVLYYLRDHPGFEARLADIAASFEEAVVEVLAAKTINAARTHKARAIIIGGGVAANRKLRETLFRSISRELPGTAFLVPDIALTGDNALMIGAAALFTGKRFAPHKVGAKADLKL